MRALVILAVGTTFLLGCAQTHDRTDGAPASDAPSEVWRGDAMYWCTSTSSRGGGWTLAWSREPAGVCGELPGLPALGVRTTGPALEEGRRYELPGAWVTDLDGSPEPAEGFVDVLEWRPDTRVRIAFSYITASGMRIEGQAVLARFCRAAVAC